MEDATHNSSAVIATVKMCSPFEERGRIVLACPKPCRWTDAVTAAKEVVGMTSLLIFISSITTTCIGFIEMRHVEQSSQCVGSALYVLEVNDLVNKASANIDL